MNDGSDFLLCDDARELGERILVFAGGKGKQALPICSVFFMDGIIMSSSKQYYQIYAIR